jgi:uncharacterized membrane protein
MHPRELSYQLRKGQSPDMTRRRWIIGLTFFGVLMGKIVALYQTGIVKRLPDPPVKGFDSTRVDASDYAYKRLNMPNAPMMIANFGVTAMLAAAGGVNRVEEQPALPIATSAKILTDTAIAAKLTQEEWAENKALCFYCNLALIASVISFALSIPEALRAIQHMREPAANKSLPHVAQTKAAEIINRVVEQPEARQALAEERYP